jgi:hypothetical protein
MEPILRDGETYTLPRDTDRKPPSHTGAPPNRRLRGGRNGEIVGTYFLRANQGGGGMSQTAAS